MALYGIKDIVQVVKYMKMIQVGSWVNLAVICVEGKLNFSKDSYLTDDR